MSGGWFFENDNGFETGTAGEAAADASTAQDPAVPDSPQGEACAPSAHPPSPEVEQEQSGQGNASPPAPRPAALDEDGFGWGTNLTAAAHDRDFPEFPTRAELTRQVARLAPGDHVTAEFDDGEPGGRYTITGILRLGAPEQSAALMFIGPALVVTRTSRPSVYLVRVEVHGRAS